MVEVEVEADGSNQEAAKSNSKGAEFAYSGAVAQRALFGSFRRRGVGKKSGGRDAKSLPSRLSKVSAAENQAK